MFFFNLPESVTNAFADRGVAADQICYTAKADVSKENQYEEIYLALTRDELCILYGHERFVGRKRRETRILYDISNCRTFPLTKIKEVVIDRLYTVSSFIIRTDDEEITVCRLSLSSIGLFEKFRSRILALRDGTPIDDSGLKDEHRVCPKCKRPYPNQERTICPNCLSNTTSFKRLLKEYLSYKKEAALIFVLILISSVLTLVTPLFSSRMFYDQVLTEPSVADGTVYGKYYGQLVMIVLLIFAIKLIATFFSSIYGIIVSKISCDVLHRLRVKIFSSMQRLSVNFFVSKATGTLMTRIDDDSDWLYHFFVDLVPYYIVSVLTVAGLVVVMCTISPLLTLLIFASILVIGFFISRLQRYLKRLHRRQHRAVRSMKSTITDSLGGQKVVKSFAREEQEVSRFDARNQNYFQTRIDAGYYNASRFPILRMIYRLSEIAIFGLGAVLVIKGNITLGALTALIAYSDMALNSIEFFMSSANEVARSMDSASRMFEILDTEPSVRESDHPVRISRMRGDIAVKNISFEYEVGRPVIKGVSFEVGAGQMIGLVGRTGAGKSTLINLIARLYDVTEGEITIDGVNIKDIAFEDLRRNIGVVTQETYLFMDTIAGNIRYARPDASMDEVIAAAKAAYAHDFILRFPEGYDTKVGNGGVQLSGGERQRISIARAILQDPAILILDEATAAMDTQTERNIQTAIERLRKGKTIISIAHRLSTLRDADSLAVIDDGELSEKGTHRELLDLRGVYYNLHKIQLDSLKFINQD
ncbi:MAG: ABC transporter ATP-binding protein [Candidatus Merdivicinus sp.]